MRSRIWTAACAAMALGTTVGILAQDPQSAPSSPQSTSPKAITVSGCVNKAESPTGTTGTTGAMKGAETKFVLSNASLAGATGTSGATAPPAMAIASEYKLDADAAKLTPHVGHKVEVTGTVEQPMGGEAKPPASAATAPTLKVDKIKLVAETCQ